MKFLLVLSLLFAGCQSAAPTPILPLPAKSTPKPQPVAAVSPPPSIPASIPPSAALEQKIRQQAQVIEALASQNDALTAKLAAQPVTSDETALPSAPPSPPDLAPTPAPPIEALMPSPISPATIIEPSLAPNADGVIDLAAVQVAAAQVEPVNPFAVRTLPPEAIREITLHVGGIITGPMPCAIINERLVQSGEMIESLAVERIESDAVFLRHGEHRMRLPVSEKSARVRLPL